MSLSHAPTMMPDYSLARERIKTYMLWLTCASSFFVLSEPAPYEILCISAGVLFFSMGTKIPAIVWALIFLLLAWISGGFISTLQVYDQPKVLLWVLISGFMGTTAVVFASIIYENPIKYFNTIRKGVILAACIGSTLGIIGYFGQIELFTRFGRAKGAFEDPNVLGAYLIFPAILCLQSIFEKGFRISFITLLAAFVILGGIFFSFSRAAWGMTIFSSLFLALSMIATSQDASEKRRIIGLLLVMLIISVFALIALLSIPQVSEIFESRASLDQDYDGGHLGRFGRHYLGFLLALDKPIGIGPLQFINFFPEDPHNTFLNAFMSYGWLGGFIWITIIVTTLYTSFKSIHRQLPWKNIHLATLSAFLGLTFESFIIDVDHWRHYWLVLGILWGSNAASWAYRNNLHRHNRNSIHSNH